MINFILYFNNITNHNTTSTAVPVVQIIKQQHWKNRMAQSPRQLLIIASLTLKYQKTRTKNLNLNKIKRFLPHDRSHHHQSSDVK